MAKETFDLDNFEDIFGDDWQDKFLSRAEEEDSVEREWQPRFPVDMENTRELTDEQRKRAKRLFDCIAEHMDAHPNDDMAPLICITQDWRVRVDFGGWNSDSDYRDTALCVMAHDDEGFYLDLEYMEQCVPFIEDKLKEAAEWCMEMYGEVPDHHEDDMKRVTEMEMNIISILSDEDLKELGAENVLIAYDTIEQSVYPIPVDVEHDDYGGIIKYIPATEFIGNDGAIEVDKIKDFVKESLNPL